MSELEPILARCPLCEIDLEGNLDQCVTDCGHIFCVSCICRYLGHNKNQCSVCKTVVRVVKQMDSNGNDTQREAPCSVKFCNVTYILYVSIWSVQDPTEKLAHLFHLMNARLIHQGKFLKKGDVWPGTIVQLIGTKKELSDTTTSTPWYTTILSNIYIWFSILWATFLYPFKFLYLFFHSMFFGESYQSLPQQRYAPIDPGNSSQRSNQPSSFQQPGTVSIPRVTETIE